MANLQCREPQCLRPAEYFVSFKNPGKRVKSGLCREHYERAMFLDCQKYRDGEEPQAASRAYQEMRK